jgi:hypothetical protein
MKRSEKKEFSTRQNKIKQLLKEIASGDCLPERRDEIKSILKKSLTPIPCLQEPFRCLIDNLFNQLKNHPEILAQQWPAIILMCSKNPVYLDELDLSLFED